MAESPFYWPTSHMFFNIIPTFGQLFEKIMRPLFICADREDIGLWTSFCFMRIGPKIILILAIS